VAGVGRLAQPDINRNREAAATAMSVRRSEARQNVEKVMIIKKKPPRKIRGAARGFWIWLV